MVSEDYLHGPRARSILQPGLIGQRFPFILQPGLIGQRLPPRSTTKPIRNSLPILQPGLIKQHSPSVF